MSLRHCISYNTQLDLFIDTLSNHLLPISHHDRQRWIRWISLPLSIQKILPHLWLLSRFVILNARCITSRKVRHPLELLSDGAHLSPFWDFECNQVIATTRWNHDALLYRLGRLFDNFLLLRMRLADCIGL
jgi:hypothetical protein